MPMVLVLGWLMSFWVSLDWFFSIKMALWDGLGPVWGSEDPV